jgi:hypothetical protein
MGDLVDGTIMLMPVGRVAGANVRSRAVLRLWNDFHGFENHNDRYANVITFCNASIKNVSMSNVCPFVCFLTLYVGRF